MKALRYILVALLVAAAIGLLCYQGFVSRDLDGSDVFRCVIIVAGAVLALFKSKKRPPVTNKKVVYQKAYSQFIQDPFSHDSKLEKRFYDAVHDYARNKPSAALSKLEKLRKECQRTADLYAVTVFTALVLDDLQQYTTAIECYVAALNIRPNSSLYSNVGICLMRIGDYERAESAYRSAMQADPNNAFPCNNLSALYFRLGEYEEALEYAQQAIALDQKMPQALATAAICSALLEDDDGYERYYRQAVACGYDGKKIKNTIAAMDPSL